VECLLPWSRCGAPDRPSGSQLQTGTHARSATGSGIVTSDGWVYPASVRQTRLRHVNLRLRRTGLELRLAFGAHPERIHRQSILLRRTAQPSYDEGLSWPAFAGRLKASREKPPDQAPRGVRCGLLGQPEAGQRPLLHLDGSFLERTGFWFRRKAFTPLNSGSRALVAAPGPGMMKFQLDLLMDYGSHGSRSLTYASPPTFLRNTSARQPTPPVFLLV